MIINRTFHNVLVSPIVIFVRAPLMLLTMGLVKVGEIADKLYWVVNDNIPAFVSEKEKPIWQESED